ncbi:putative protoheme IX biogenesis protein [compost metagenome]
MGKLTPQQEEDLLHQAWTGRLEAAGEALETLRPVWQELPRKLRQDPVLLASYGDRLRQLGADGEAAELWLEALRKQPAPELFARLPRLKLDDYQPMLTLLQKLQDQPGAEAALAQVYLLAGQLDEAQRLLEQEVKRAPSAAVCHALGQLMDKRRLTNKANEYYRQALALAGI